MHVANIIPPGPIVLPSDMGGDNGDIALKALIQAVTEEIDGLAEGQRLAADGGLA